MKASLIMALLLLSSSSFPQVVPNPEVQEGQSSEEQFYQGDPVAPMGSEDEMMQEEEEAPSIFSDTNGIPEDIEVYEDEVYEELPEDEYQE